MKEQSQLLPFEKRVAGILACVYMARMYGLFILLPILVPAAEQLPNATPILIGIALGIYGLPQIALHALLGKWSDRIGRKPVIAFGLLLFILGCGIAVFAETITGLIVGRFFQGSGAIGAVTMAYASDLTRAEQRSKVFAVMGISIGGAFLLAMMTGPILYAAWGLSGVFIVSAIFAALSGVIMLGVLPAPMVTAKPAMETGFVETLRNKELLRLGGGTLVLHFILMANFLVLPSMISSSLNLEVGEHWKLYIPVLLSSFVLMLPFLVVAEKFRKIKHIALLMIVLIAVSQGLMQQFGSSAMPLILSLLLFFVAFNYLEANLPSLVSRICPTQAKGVSLGVFYAGAVPWNICGWLHRWHSGTTVGSAACLCDEHAGGLAVVYVDAGHVAATRTRTPQRALREFPHKKSGIEEKRPYLGFENLGLDFLLYAEAGSTQASLAAYG